MNITMELDHEIKELHYSPVDIYPKIIHGPLYTMFKDKDIAVIGGGNAGFEESLDLIKYVKKIYIIEFLEKTCLLK